MAQKLIDLGPNSEVLVPGDTSYSLVSPPVTTGTLTDNWDISPSSITYEGQTYQADYYKPFLGDPMSVGENGWYYVDENSYPTDLQSTDPNAEYFTYTFGGEPVTAVRIRTDATADLSNLAINSFTPSGDIVLTPPPAVQEGKGRDFYIKATASVPTTLTITGVTLTSSVGGTVVLSMAASTTSIWHLTETDTNVFKVEGANEAATMYLLAASRMGRPNYATATRLTDIADKSTGERAIYTAAQDGFINVVVKAGSGFSQDVELYVYPGGSSTAKILVAACTVISNQRVTMPAFLASGDKAALNITSHALESGQYSFVPMV